MKIGICWERFSNGFVIQPVNLIFLPIRFIIFIEFDKAAFVDFRFTKCHFCNKTKIFQCNYNFPSQNVVSFAFCRETIHCMCMTKVVFISHIWEPLMGCFYSYYDMEGDASTHIVEDAECVCRQTTQKRGMNCLSNHSRISNGVLFKCLPMEEIRNCRNHFHKLFFKEPSPLRCHIIFYLIPLHVLVMQMPADFVWY